jgi:hypothetical protein
LAIIARKRPVLGKLFLEFQLEDRIPSSQLLQFMIEAMALRLQKLPKPALT